MAKKMKALSTFVDALKDQIDSLYNEAQAVHEQNSYRYRDSWRYYLGRSPAPLNGRSDLDYVEPVLYEAVQQITPSLLNIFTENDQKAVSYRIPHLLKVNPDFAKLEEKVNVEINKIFLKKNNGYKVLEDSFKECLITGDAFIKFFIEEKFDNDEITFNDFVPVASLVAAADDWSLDLPSPVNEDGSYKTSGKYKRMSFKLETKDSEGKDLEQPEMFVKGTISIYKQDKCLKIEQVDYKDVYFDPTCGSDFKKCRYFVHRKIMSVGDAINEGFKESDLIEASTVNVLADDPLNKENVVVNAIYSGDFTGNAGFDEIVADPLERKIMIYEHYVYSSLPSGKTALYEVVATDNTILSVQPVSRIPFVHMQYETIAGSLYGRSMFDICRPFQDELSHFTRIMKHIASRSAFGAYSAVRGAYDRGSLIGLEAGSVVEVQEQGSVQLLQMPEISPSVQVYMQRLSEQADKAVISGSDSITTPDGAPQLAASAIAMLISQSEMKDKTAAKCIARTGIQPLFEGLYEVMREEGFMIEDHEVSIPADQLPSIYEFTIDINTSNDAAIQLSGLNTIVQSVAQLQQMQGGLVSAQNLYNFAEFQCKQYGLSVDKFFTDPSKQPQPTPEELQEQANNAAAQKESGLLALDGLRADIALKNAQTAHVEAQISELFESGKSQREREKERSLREFQKLESETNLNNAKTQFETAKLQLDGIAVDHEIKSGEKNITGIRTA